MRYELRDSNDRSSGCYSSLATVIATAVVEHISRIWDRERQQMIYLCKGCGAMLEHDEIPYLECDGCMVDRYEAKQREREQRWLEDDRNWPVTG